MEVEKYKKNRFNNIIYHCHFYIRLLREYGGGKLLYSAHDRGDDDGAFDGDRDRDGNGNRN